jgi:hypothetical protein
MTAPPPKSECSTQTGELGHHVSVPRLLRIVLASVTSALLVLCASLVVVIGTGRTLEDACATEPPPDFAPELTAVRGPIREGLATFRCEHVDAPHTAYVFMDLTPVTGTTVVGLATVVALVVVWRWAARRPRPA